MKSIKFHQIGFITSTIVMTVLFRYFLALYLNQAQYVMPWALAALYFDSMFAIGWYFGKRAHQLLPIVSLTFRFHLYTFMIFTGISFIWFKFNFVSIHENFKTFQIGIIIWLIMLLLHFGISILKSKNAIKGLAKTDIFE